MRIRDILKDSAILVGLKADTKKDDGWKSPGGEVTHKGKADVTVPASRP